MSRCHLCSSNGRRLLQIHCAILPGIHPTSHHPLPAAACARFAHFPEWIAAPEWEPSRNDELREYDPASPGQAGRRTPPISSTPAVVASEMEMSNAFGQHL